MLMRDGYKSEPTRWRQIAGGIKNDHWLHHRAAAPADQPGPPPHRHELGYRLDNTGRAELASTTDGLASLIDGGATSVSIAGSDFTSANKRLEAPRPKDPLIQGTPS